MLPFAIPALISAQGADLTIGDFESADYASWTATGTAFGSQPASGTLANQQEVSGFMGHGLVNTFLGGDGATGTLESPSFTIQRKYLNFMIGGGSHPLECFLELIVDGKPVRTAAGIESEALSTTTFDLSAWPGKTARIRIVDNATGGWGHILVDQIDQSNESKSFLEDLRPQFHFTAPKGWLNDPNGLVFYKGEYHIFYQHNPFGIGWGNMTWGHAVSPDLIHWQHLPLAIQPDNASCTAYSGSAVVDWDNTAGFQTGSEKPLIILWTSIGCGQRLAYSNDKGRTWTKWDGNPIIAQEGDARDPKVFWYAPTKKWILAVWTPARGGGISFYSSPNLKQWTWMSIAPGFFECPNFFELPVDGNQAAKKWVLHGADGKYSIGKFDGTAFTKESGPYDHDWGRNWYASQVYSDIPATDGRAINISWMRGGNFPGMPFNGQMSIPTSLSLKTFADGVRLAKLPVREIADIRIHSDTLKNLTLDPGQNPLSAFSGQLFDVSAEFELAGAKQFGFKLRDTAVTYDVAARTLSVLGGSAPLPPIGNRIKIRVLLDRASLETYGNDGEVSFTDNFIPVPGHEGLEVFSVGGPVKIISLEVHKLRGSWDPKDLQAAWEKSAQTVVGVLPGHKANAIFPSASNRGPANPVRDFLGRADGHAKRNRASIGVRMIRN